MKRNILIALAATAAKTESKKINVQVYDSGALGCGGTRVVEVKPFMGLWIVPTETDTAAISKNEWVMVNETFIEI